MMGRTFSPISTVTKCVDLVFRELAMKYWHIFTGFVLMISTCGSLFGQDKYAIIVGVETYDPGMFENLKYTEDDAHRLGAILDDYGYKTTVMTSDAESIRLKPYTAKNIMTAIRTRANSCSKGDTLIVSISGHGIQFKDEEKLDSGVKETYFCPSGADHGDKSTLLPISELVELVNSCKATRKLILIDACRNEVLSKAAQNKSSSKKIVLESVHESRQSIPGGMSVLFSCSSEQYSWESNDLKSSVFSHYVAEYLDGSADGRFYDNGKLTLDDLVAYVRKKTNDYVFENNFTSDGQNPVMRGEAANWPVAVVTGLESYSEAEVELVRRHAKLGVGNAQLYFGNCFYYGVHGLEQNYKEALKWFQKAAEQGLADAQNNAGVIYQHGLGVEQNYKEAMKWYAKAAEQGNADGQNNVGFFLQEGHGVEQNYKEAMKWYAKAAGQGNADGQFNIASLYESGHGVEQNYEEALNWYVTAAEQGLADAQHRVGYFLQNGYGVEQDYKEAMKWYSKASEQGNAISQNFIGVLFQFGLGVEQNYPEALKWYRKSADQGVAIAQNNVGFFYQHGHGVGQSYHEAVKWFQKSAEQGNADGQNNIGYLYYEGHGVKQNFQQALAWYAKAAVQGNSSAQYNVAVMYLNGQGVARNRQEARRWFEKAAAQGHEGAQRDLKMLNNR